MTVCKPIRDLEHPRSSLYIIYPLLAGVCLPLVTSESGPQPATTDCGYHDCGNFFQSSLMTCYVPPLVEWANRIALGLNDKALPIQE